MKLTKEIVKEISMIKNEPDWMMEFRLKSFEYFDKAKLLSGLMKACQKRPVDSAEIADKIEAELQNSLRQEISSVEIGEMVMRELRARDAVAYVRFASVYREFKDVETFMSELQNFLNK